MSDKINYESKVHATLSYSNTCANIRLIPESISELLNKLATESPSKVGYIFPHNKENGLELTFSELNDKVNKVAQNLLKLGLVKGDIIAFSLPNTHELLVSFFAAARLGLISLFIEPLNQIMEFEFFLNKTQAKALIYTDICELGLKKQQEIIEELCPEIKTSQAKVINSSKFPFLKNLIYLQGKHEITPYECLISFDDLLVANDVELEFPLVNSQDPAVIMFTSGTTGQRKGVLMSQFAIINTGHMFGFIPNESNSETWINRLCNQFQMYHASNLHTGIITPLVCGNQVVFPSFISNEMNTLKAIEKYKCNSLYASTRHVENLVMILETNKFNLESLEYVSTAATAMSSDLIDKLKREYNIKSYVSNYGSTEMCGTGLTTLISDQYISDEYAHKSLGRPLPFYEAKVVDTSTHQIQPLNVPGELWFRGFALMIGYYNEAEKTRETLTEHGWLKTGDEVVMDKNGFIFYKNRIKDVIHGQFKIYPSEVEYLLKNHEQIEEASVFGVEIKPNNELTCAWVQLKVDSELTIQQLKEYCNQNMAAFKVPVHFKIVQSFPINATGKILKRILAELFKKELIDSNLLK